MKYLAIILALLLATPVPAADCVDNLDGTSDCTLTVQNTGVAQADEILDAMEQGAHEGWANDAGPDEWNLVILATTTTTVSPPVTSTQKKDMLEQVRKLTNYKYRCGGAGTVCAGDDQLAAPAWVYGMMEGFEDTQHKEDGEAATVVHNTGARLWARFVDWVGESQCAGSVDNCLTEALAIVVPAPPSP
jgi:hypothetical protein